MTLHLHSKGTYLPVFLQFEILTLFVSFIIHHSFSSDSNVAPRSTNVMLHSGKPGVSWNSVTALPRMLVTFSNKAFGPVHNSVEVNRAGTSVPACGKRGGYWRRPRETMRQLDGVGPVRLMRIHEMWPPLRHGRSWKKI